MKHFFKRVAAWLVLDTDMGPWLPLGMFVLLFCAVRGIHVPFETLAPAFMLFLSVIHQRHLDRDKARERHAVDVADAQNLSAQQKTELDAKITKVGNFIADHGAAIEKLQQSLADLKEGRLPLSIGGLKR